MRSILLFAIRLLATAMVFAYVFAYLAAPCMPLADPSGQAQAIPRWEYWLLHVSVPTAIWWQWSGGNLPVTMLDRLPILLAATIWIVSCLFIGSLLSRLDPIWNRLSKYERIGVAVLVGHVTLAAIVFLFGSIVGVPWLVWAIAFLIGIAFVLSRFRTRQVAAVSTLAVVVDVSFASSISRRMIGLLILASVFLAGVQVYGASVPTRDMQVREVDWWLVKHATLDGKLTFSTNNAIANAPAGFAMPAVAFSSAFMLDLPSITDLNIDTIASRERLQERLLLSVLAGKTVEAMLGLCGVFLVSVHLGRRWGYLSGLFIGFLLIATPGLSELNRLGRTEGLIGIWVVGLLVVWNATSELSLPKASLGVLWGFMVAGALSSGYGAAALVGVPACCLWLSKQRLPWFRTEAIAEPHNLKSESGLGPSWLAGFVILIAACGFYVRNGIGGGDPIYPWGRFAAEKLVLAKASEMGSGLAYAHRVPSETVSEMIGEADAVSATDTPGQIKSPYRVANWLDGLFRLFWNSSGHGLLLVPLATVGIFCYWSHSTIRMAVGWVGFWVLVWWLFSMRQDRDWMGTLYILAWPAAAGAQWLAARVRGYPMMVLVSIAICWSIVVIPIWPMSDNRILVSLEALDQNRTFVAESILPDGENSETPTYASCFNALYRESNDELSKRRVLLVGENDDFDLWADCIGYGPFDHGLDSMAKSPQAFAEFLHTHGVSDVIVVWSGVQYREKLTDKKTESDYRTVLSEMLKDSHLRPIPWEINSSQAELFRVIKE